LTHLIKGKALNQAVDEASNNQISGIETSLNDNPDNEVKTEMTVTLRANQEQILKHY
jgi:hypothetical protein